MSVPLSTEAALAAEARALAAKIGKRAKLKKGRAAKVEYALARDLRRFARTAQHEKSVGECQNG